MIGKLLDRSGPCCWRCLSRVSSSPVSDRTKISNARVARTALWVIAAVLVFASSCAQKDWVDRTPVTVDVTGVWEGTQAGTGNRIELVLKQEGAKVTGEMKGIRKLDGTEEPPFPIVGTVSGDTVSFREESGEPFRVQVLVNGDEMTGIDEMSEIAQGTFKADEIALRRRQ